MTERRRHPSLQVLPTILCLLLLPALPARASEEETVRSPWGAFEFGLRCRVSAPAEIEEGLPLPVTVELDYPVNRLSEGVAPRLETQIPDAFLTLLLTREGTDETIEVAPYDPTSGLPFSFRDAGSEAAPVAGSALPKTETRFPLATISNVLRPGRYRARVRFAYPGPATRWPAPDEERMRAGFWQGAAVSGPFTLVVKKEPLRDTKLRLPARLLLDERLRVVFPEHEWELAEIQVRNGFFTICSWYRDGELFQVAGPPAPGGGPIDSWEGHVGPLAVTYRLEVGQTSRRPNHPWEPGDGRSYDTIFLKREYRVVHAAEGTVESAKDPLPPGAVARLGTVRLRHPGHVGRVVFSPDGALLAAGSMSWAGDRRVRVWDAASGKLRHEFARRSAGASAPAFSPDGKLLAVADDQGATLWDLGTGERVRSVPMVPWKEGALFGGGGTPNHVSCVRFSPDGKLLALGGACAVSFMVPEEETTTVVRRLTLVNLATGREVRQFAHERSVHDVAFSPDGDLLAAADGTGVKVWEVPTGELRYQITGVRMPGRARFTPDGDRLLLTLGGQLKVLEAATGREVFFRQGREINALALSRDGRLIATGGWRMIRLWDAKTWRLLREFVAGHTNVSSLAFNPDGGVLASNAGHAVRRWDVEWARTADPGAGHEDRIVALRYSPDGRTVATAAADGTVRLWDRDTGVTRAVLRGNDRFVNGIAFSPDGKTLVTAGSSGYLKLWNTAGGVQQGRLSPRISGKEAVAWSPDGTTLAIGGRNGSLLLFEVATKKAGRRWGAPGGEGGIVRVVVYSPDGSRLAAAGPGGGLAVLYGAGSDEAPRVLLPGQTPARAIAFSPDGRSLLTVSEQARVLDLESGEAKLELEGFKGETDGGACAWSPDGRFLAVAGGDGIVRLYAAGGEPLASFEGHEGPVHALAFSPDGKMLVSGGEDTTALVWYVEGR